jgi:hypothetical protein
MNARAYKEGGAGTDNMLGQYVWGRGRGGWVGGQGGGAEEGDQVTR